MAGLAGDFGLSSLNDDDFTRGDLIQQGQGTEFHTFKNPSLYSFASGSSY